MFRARLASVIVAAGLAAASSGCSSCFEFRPCGLFGGHGGGCCPREGCCPAPGGCCDGGLTTGSSPVEGPVLAPEQFSQANGSAKGSGMLPLANQPRLQPAPQSTPTPYTP
jgi:hypothetical protein